MYQLTEATTIIRLADSAFIPAEPSNLDYQEYLAWVTQGNQPLPYTPPPPPPPVLHMADFRLALLADGLLEQVEAFMAGPDVSPECQILWEYATQVHRDDQYLNQMAAAMGFTDAQIDAVFGIGGTHGE